MSNIKFMRPNSIIRNEDEKVKMKEIFTPNATELFNRAGLWLLVKSLSYFGFKISESPRNHCCLNRPYVAFLLTSTFIAFAFNCYIRYALVINNGGSFDMESVSFYIVITGGTLVAIFMYVFGIINARNYSTLFKSLALAVDQISDSKCRQKFTRSVKRIFFLGSIFCFIMNTLLAISSFSQGEYWMYGQSEMATLLFACCSSTFNFMWFVTVGQFYLFTGIYLTISCKMIDFLIDIYLGPKVNNGELFVDNVWSDPKQWDKVRADEINQKLINHRKLSQIVDLINSAFTQYLLFTLTIETSVCIALVKMLTIKNGAYSVLAYGYMVHIAMMLWKLFICGNVNEKEQVSYVLYLEEQNINRAEITYGNLFPIGKTFIFTIIGTVFTYAMVLHGM